MDVAQIEQLGRNIDVYLMVVNMIAYLLFLLEGMLKKNRNTLIPVPIHLLAALVGGWIGSLMGIYTAKTRQGQKGFLYIVVAIGVVWLIVFVAALVILTGKGA